MARQIGGEHIEVVDLLKPNGNLHSFEPTPKDLAEAGKSRLLLASGKQLEPYLSRLKEAIGAQTKILDLGAGIPDVMISSDSDPEHEDCSLKHDHNAENDKTHSCCAHGPADPHWWHSPSNMKRAARTLTAALIKEDPNHEQDYRLALAQWNKKMDRLASYARAALSSIPDNKRILVTGHAAMNHFCRDFGFRSICIQGISREDEGNPAQLASVLKKLRETKAQAIFPEYSSNPKSLQEIAKALHIKLAQPIYTDGLAPEAHTFETMFNANLRIIVDALNTQP